MNLRQKCKVLIDRTLNVCYTNLENTGLYSYEMRSEKMTNVTIKDIARIANVSYATVSRALNNHKDVNEQTRQRILKICKEVGYTPNAIARGLVKQSTHTIGLLVPDITNPYYPEVARGVEDEASKNNYNVFLCNTDWDIMKEVDYFNLLIAKRVEGIIIAPVSDDTTKFIDKFADRLPIIFLGTRVGGDKYNYIVIDNVKGGEMITEYLIGLGHRRIAFVGGIKESCTFADRSAGYKNALRKHNIEIDENLIYICGYRKKDGSNALRTMIKKSDMPTAIFAINDLVALGVIKAAEELGISIPDDISLAGFDDIPYASLPKIRLTTVLQPKDNIGRESVRILFEKLENKDIHTGLQRIIQPELKIRSTCKSVL